MVDDWPADWRVRLRIAVLVPVLLFVSLSFFGYFWVMLASLTGLQYLTPRGQYVWGLLLIVPSVLIGLCVGWWLLRKESAYGLSSLHTDLDADLVDAETVAPGVAQTTQRLAQAAEIPQPTLKIAQTRIPVSYSVGMRQSTASVVLSEGIIEALSEDELEAVLAHELAHVRNRDAALVTLLSLQYVYPRFLRRKIHRPSSTELSAVEELRSFLGTVFWGFVAFVTVGPSFMILLLFSPVLLLNYVLHRSFSRARELSADRGAVALTGNPAALARALRTLDDRLASTPMRDLRVSRSSSTLSILPLNERSWLSLLHTHPPTERRIERLRSLQASLDT
jgi:heat shock protein HtpX